MAEPQLSVRSAKARDLARRLARREHRSIADVVERALEAYEIREAGREPDEKPDESEPHESGRRPLRGEVAGEAACGLARRGRALKLPAEDEVASNWLARPRARRAHMLHTWPARA